MDSNPTTNRSTVYGSGIRNKNLVTVIGRLHNSATDRLRHELTVLRHRVADRFRALQQPILACFYPDVYGQGPQFDGVLLPVRKRHCRLEIAVYGGGRFIAGDRNLGGFPVPLDVGRRLHLMLKCGKYLVTGRFVSMGIDAGKSRRIKPLECGDVLSLEGCSQCHVVGIQLVFDRVAHRKRRRSYQQGEGDCSSEYVHVGHVTNNVPHAGFSASTRSAK